MRLQVTLDTFSEVPTSRSYPLGGRFRDEGKWCVVAGVLALLPMKGLAEPHPLVTRLEGLLESGVRFEGTARLEYTRERWSERFELQFESIYHRDYVFIELEEASGDRTIVFQDRVDNSVDYYVSGRPMIDEVDPRMIASRVAGVAGFGPVWFYEIAEEGVALGNFDRIDHDPRKLEYELKPEKVDHSSNRTIRPSQTRILALTDQETLQSDHWVHLPGEDPFNAFRMTMPLRLRSDSNLDLEFISIFYREEAEDQAVRGKIQRVSTSCPERAQMLKEVLPQKVKKLTRMSYARSHPAKPYNAADYRENGTPADRVPSAIERHSGKTPAALSPGGESGRKARTALFVVGTLLVLLPLLVKALRRDRARR